VSWQLSAAHSTKVMELIGARIIAYVGNNQPTNQLTSINQPNNQPTNQPTNQWRNNSLAESFNVCGAQGAPIHITEWGPEKSAAQLTTKECNMM